MIHVQLPPSMLSSSGLCHKLNGVLPPIRQPQDFAWDWNRASCSRGGHNHTPPLGFRRYNHGLRTPPKDMSATDSNPLLAPNGGGHSYQRVPVIGSNAASYQTSQSAIDNSKNPNNRQPFYNSYYSAKKPQSPAAPKKDKVALSEQTARRRASSDGNSIASHLQIPASINDSKGSLPEFAAQVRAQALSTSSITVADRF